MSMPNEILAITIFQIVMKCTFDCIYAFQWCLFGDYQMFLCKQRFLALIVDRDVGFGFEIFLVNLIKITYQ